MLLPVRCFTCNRVICDEKLTYFEKNRMNSYQSIEAKYKETYKKAMEMLPPPKDGQVNTLVMSPYELKDEFKYTSENPQKYFTVSPTSDFHILNILGIEHVCCRRMFLGYVNLIDKIN